MRYDIGTLSLCPRQREIEAEGTRVPVEPKVFDLLVFLIENRERVVSKDELIAAIWDDRAISDTTLSSAIKSARRVLGDNGQDQRLIRTFQRRGFRFVGPVSERPEDNPVSQDPAGVAPASFPDPSAEPCDPDQESRHGIDLTPPSRPSIAVLPFIPLGEGDGQPLLAQGIVHDLTVRLARTRWLFVTARASASRFHAQTTDPVDIGRSLGVRYLLHGTLASSGDRVRVTAVLTNAAEGCEIWAEAFDRNMADIFSLQDDISELVASAVESEIDMRERRLALLQPIGSLDAWSAYHRATDLLYRFSPENYNAAESYLKLAARLEPGSPRILAARSFLAWQRAFMDATDDRDREIAQATEFAQQCITLDPLDPQGHWALGRAALLTGEFSQAVEELCSAVDLNPNFANGHYSLAFARMLDNHSADGFDGIIKARRLSPYDPMTFAFLALNGELFSFTGEDREAVEWVRRAMRQPNAHHHIYAIAAWIHERAGQHEEALALVQRARAIRPNYSSADYFRAFPFVGEQRAMIERAFHNLGM